MVDLKKIPANKVIVLEISQILTWYKHGRQNQKFKLDKEKYITLISHKKTLSSNLM
jgi:hypothetical protein